MLAAALIAGATPGPSASPPAGQNSQPHCVIENRYSPFTYPCAPFTKVGIRIKAAIPSSAFGTDAPPADSGILDDGSVMVQTDRHGLYRIAGGRLQRLWPPGPRCEGQLHFEFAFTGSFDDEVLATVNRATSAAMRSDGLLAFRLPLAFDSVAQDAGGVVWLSKGGYADQTLYAYFPRTRVRLALQSPKGVYLFRSPNGHVYASNFDGLFELDSQPTVQARLVHGPLRWEQVQSYFELGLAVSPIQAVGREGSLWASTATQVIHVHPNGALHAMRFLEPPNRITMPLQAIPLTMTRDGAVWAWGKTIRIDNSDRIQVLTLPQQDEVDRLRFGPDSSVWLVIRDARNDRPLGVVNVAPAALARNAAAWPFTLPANAVSPTPCPFPTTPPTPTPPLPPKNGPVNFVYAAGGSPDGVWGYWAGRSGKLTPVRGAPFGAKDVWSLSIDPAGRHLYVGAWWDGIHAYAIDAQRDVTPYCRLTACCSGRTDDRRLRSSRSLRVRGQPQRKERHGICSRFPERRPETAGVVAAGHE